MTCLVLFLIAVLTLLGIVAIGLLTMGVLF